ncbi:glucose/arabinose dehydrogenase [Neomicrococcus aestuarii]|uniref:Glucose/arabinose dehydrogenase n=1 Tax=Neomicrococcus aestuarii TaxID=556325 RepID=A0A7W8TTW2_9MICC|nr:PQQ-dependent sugar dehydrogenase [Neomicrococcus aestuarii]MBB5512786.1 glucose/arabinose dehydrogenase [Neomicrococcus aestuarii]
MTSRRGFLISAAALAVAGQTACVPNAGTGSQAASSSGQISSTTTQASAPSATFAAPLVPQAPRVALEGLNSPWQIAFLPDDSGETGNRSALITSRDTGVVYRADVPLEASEAASLSEFAQVPDVYHGGEGGLLGLALAPGFYDSPRAYVYRSAQSGNQLLTTTDFKDFEVLVGDIPRGRIHNGGRLAWGLDDSLFVGTGDAGQAENAQNPNSWGGKILRVAIDPNTGKPQPVEIYSFGHRNVQGIAFTSSNQMWATELGPDRNDELQRIVKGGNYGWPAVTGYDITALDGVTTRPAQHVWESTADASPSGLAIFQNTAFVASLRGQRLWIVSLPQGSTEAEELAPGPLPQLDPPEFHGSRLRDVAVTQDGQQLWIITDEGESSKLLVCDLG